VIKIARVKKAKILKVQIIKDMNIKVPILKTKLIQRLCSKKLPWKLTLEIKPITYRETSPTLKAIPKVKEEFLV
jgi:hypothetical protein